MSWYSKIVNASARDDKISQIDSWIVKLDEAIDGSSIDKERSRSIVENVIERVNGRGELSLVSPTLKEEVKKVLELANSFILDSPAKFDSAVEESIIALEDYKSTLES
jgi:hypothetical protein